MRGLPRPTEPRKPRTTCVTAARHALLGPSFLVGPDGALKAQASYSPVLRTEHHYVSSPPAPITLYRRGIRLYRVSPSSGTRMPATTPIARSKTAALARILDCVPKGYHRYTCGTVSAGKAEALARKFHALYGIGCTPAQRITRKGKGLANAVLVMYWPQDAEQVEWLLLATNGNGLEGELLRLVEEAPRLHWLGYEMVRHPSHGRTVWTWRRPKLEMAELHALLAFQASQRHYAALAETLERIARQPGFHGVRTQSWSLFQEACRRGYAGPLPHLFYLQKISHGDQLTLAP